MLLQEEEEEEEEPETLAYTRMSRNPDSSEQGSSQMTSESESSLNRELTQRQEQAAISPSFLQTRSSPLRPGLEAREVTRTSIR